MDGKSGAEDLIAKVLSDPALLQTLRRRARDPRMNRANRRAGRNKPCPGPEAARQARAAERRDRRRRASSPSLLTRSSSRRPTAPREAVEAAVQTLAEQALSQHHS